MLIFTFFKNISLHGFGNIGGIIRLCSLLEKKKKQIYADFSDLLTKPVNFMMSNLYFP